MSYKFYALFMNLMFLHDRDPYHLTKKYIKFLY